MDINAKLLTEKHVEGVLDRVGSNHVFKVLIISAWFGYLFDCFDNGILGYCMPLISKELSIDSVLKGYILAAALWGGVLGQFLWGYLADKLGRKFAFQGTLLTFALFTGFTACAWSPISLLGARFLTGMGLNGFVPVDLTMVSEFSPTRIRGRLTGSVSLLSSVGMVLAVLSTLLLLPVVGWRSMFLIGVIPAVLVWVIRRKVPESPRWLVSTGKNQEAIASLKQLGASDEMIKQEMGIADSDTSNKKESVGMGNVFELFLPKNRKAVFLGWILWLSTLFAYMSLAGWLPTIFIDVYKFSITKSLSYTLAAAVCGLLGRFLGIYLIEKIGRRPSITYSLFLSGLCLIALIYSKNPTFLLIAAMTLYFFYDQASVCIMAYVPELFPTRIRLKGNAWCSATARICAAFAPILVGYLMNANHYHAIAWVFGASLIVPAIIMLIMGPETKGKGLEQLT